MKLRILLPLLALAQAAHADDFGDRAHQSFEQAQAAREAAQQKAIDKDNIIIIQRMLVVEKANGGQNSTGKCYDTTYDFAHSWIPVPWSSGAYSMPIYSRRTLAGQKFEMGFAYNSIMACTFNTGNGFACKVETSFDEDTNKLNPYVTCYDKKNVRYTWSGVRLVKYVAPPPTEPTPIPECASRELDWMQSQQECNRISDSNDRQICLNALGNDPGGCNR
ncbi:MAG: hypothetical protein ACXVB9_08180 [Bdellovibrionota bacterium]